MAATAAIIGAVTAVAGTSYSVIKSEQGRKDADKEKKKLLAKQQQEEEALAMRQSKEESMANAIKVRDAAKESQRRKALGQQGRAGTILTGSLGVQGSAPTAGKTLLGE
jgi:uncharacterized protein YlxW (UPF0749 family)